MVAQNKIDSGHGDRCLSSDSDGSEHICDDYVTKEPAPSQRLPQFSTKRGDIIDCTYSRDGITEAILSQAVRRC